jgi:hypothetical protein|nr:MAG TPA: hypothetical protein [Caudoviricetes sp.]
MNEYLLVMDRAAKRIARDASKTQEQDIMRAYTIAFDDAFSDYLKQLEKGKTPSQPNLTQCKLAYINQLYSTLQKQSLICNEEIPKKILNQYAKVMKDITNNKDVIDKINKNVDVTSRNIVEQMIKGEVYKDGVGLDSRLWSATNASGRKIEDVITSCLARGISSAEASKIISQFAKSGHHTWDKNKIREKLGDKYANKYGTGGLDYEALRLMRTTNTHMAQLTVMNSDTVNPYNKFVKYHTGHAGSRTCSICRDRDGKIFPIHDAPLDHPNGLCWLSPVMSKDGKTELSLADMVDDMNDYFDGKPNSGVMTQWLGKSYPRRVEPKPQQPTEPPKLTIPKGHLYTEEQREQKYQELETHLLDGISSMLETELVNNKNKDNMIKPYAKTTVKGIIGNLRKYPASIQDLYLHTLKDLKMNYTPDGAFYSPMTDSIHFSVKKTNNDNRGPYGTVFHEWGHMIDWHIYSETGGTVTNSVKEEMYKILKQDVEDRIKYQQKNSRTKINKAEAKKLVTSELNGATDAIAGVSDIYGGVTGNAVVGRWGHAKSYWTRRDKKGEVCSEAWADILQSYGIPNQAKYIEKYMPGGKAFVEKTVEEIIEKIKRGEIK